jgi:hypothetical protein
MRRADERKPGRLGFTHNRRLKDSMIAIMKYRIRKKGLVDIFYIMGKDYFNIY